MLLNILCFSPCFLFPLCILFEPLCISCILCILFEPLHMLFEPLHKAQRTLCLLHPA